MLPALLEDPEKSLRTELLLAPHKSQNLAIRQGWVVVRVFETSATVREHDAHCCLSVGSQANDATVQCGKVEASVCRDHAVEDGR